jgi:hypothetical protein
LIDWSMLAPARRPSARVATTMRAKVRLKDTI